jgi:hypothetical protein
LGYYIRVLGTKEGQPDIDFLSRKLRDAKVKSVLRLETASEQGWQQLVLTHPKGPEVAVIECNPVRNGELGKEELAEFIEEVEEYQPQSASRWLQEYLPGIKTIYAVLLFSGTDVEDGWGAVHALQSAIWRSLALLGTNPETKIMAVPASTSSQHSHP